MLHKKNPAEPQIVYSSDIDIVDMISTKYNYKKILFCNDIEQELSDISNNASSNPYVVLHQAMIVTEALQSSTGIETTPLNPYDIIFEKAKDVMPNIDTIS